MQKLFFNQLSSKVKNASRQIGEFKNKIHTFARGQKTFKKTELPLVNGKQTLAQVKDLVLSFKNPGSPNERNLVIRSASFDLYEGEVLAIIGESGSGKSVITSSLYGLVGANAVIESGTINVLGYETHNFSPKD